VRALASCCSLISASPLGKKEALWVQRKSNSMIETINFLKIKTKIKMRIELEKM
jgi:hypothetical protein